MSHLSKPLALSSEVAAEALGVSPEAVELLIEAGELETIKIGLITRIPYAALEEFIFAQLSPLAVQRIRDHFERIGRKPWWDRICDEARRVKPLRSRSAVSNAEAAPAK
ncbi:MAG: helix-turn-helix domain-containing protein [Methylocystis sp.]|uniref:helix-turn-helix domain-containing protein n=1 Tax=Methylocystis sp. TaxID=1911079 RepID=UPI003DA27EAF